MTFDPTEILLPGPWQHRFVAANGSRFHVAEAGEGPLLLMLHGFPQFWWAWRAQIPVLAEAGYRVVAMDLRGCGGSDKPPQGYDLHTLAADVAGVVRAVGESEAVIVGHDWGGYLAWAMPALQPQVTSAIATLSMGHPLSMRSALMRPGPPDALIALFRNRVPGLAERRLRNGGAAATISAGWGDGYAPTPLLARYQQAMSAPSAVHTALEYSRNVPVLAGRRTARQPVGDTLKLLDMAIEVPVLQMVGSRDRYVSTWCLNDSRDRIRGDAVTSIVTGAGHFLPEEAPSAVNDTLLGWLPRVGGQYTAVSQRQGRLDQDVRAHLR